MPEFKLKRVLNSRAYQKAQDKVASLLSDTGELKVILGKVLDKSQLTMNGRISALRGDIETMVRLSKSYVKGDYRAISAKTIASILAALLYFIMPIDAIPDFILSAGLIDDAVLIGWTVQNLKEELNAFLRWESSNSTQQQMLSKDA